MVTSFVISYVAVLVVMTGGFAIARRLRRVDVVDVCWGIAILTVAATALLFAPKPTVAAYVVTGLVAAWAYRLSTHVARRVSRSKVQDERYTELMAKWPKKFLWLQVYGKIFVVQSLLALVVAAPTIIIAESETYNAPWLLVGVSVWLFGFWFEATGDAQLARFLGDVKNKGKLMTSGLWSYTRHPNYFGEMTMWWGIWLMSVGMEWWWVGLVGPVAISLLLRFVSGVPLAEKHSSTKPGWAEYARKTPALFPKIR